MKIILENIYAMAQKEPDKLCIIGHNDQKITYRQHWNSICNYGEYLKSQGVKEDIRVGIIAEQSIRFLVAVSAVHLVGGTAVPLEKNLPVTRIDDIIRRIEIDYLIGQVIETQCKNVLDITLIDEMLMVNKKSCRKMIFPKTNGIADILFTTGTTGEPKGIIMTHQANLAIAENVIDSVHLREDDIELIPTPINHSLGLRRYYGAMLKGSSIGILEGIVYANELFKMMDKYKATAITLVPTMLSILLKFYADKLQLYNEQLKFIQIGSAPISKRDKEWLCELLPKVRLYNTYGATESGCTCILDFNKIKDKRFCIGRPTINTKITFVNDEGKVIKTSNNNLGYIVSEGPMNMSGYWNEPELTQKVLKEGKIYTNDLGYKDDEGYIYLLGRSDDVINCGGNKIAPLEIEEILLKNEKIKECACIGVDDAIAGQVPKLFVVMNPNEKYDSAEILDYLAKQLEFYKIPKYIEQIENLPHAYNGKILKNKLK